MGTINASNLYFPPNNAAIFSYLSMKDTDMTKYKSIDLKLIADIHIIEQKCYHWQNKRVIRFSRDDQSYLYIHYTTEQDTTREYNLIINKLIELKTKRKQNPTDKLHKTTSTQEENRTTSCIQGNIFVSSSTNETIIELDKITSIWKRREGQHYQIELLGLNSNDISKSISYTTDEKLRDKEFKQLKAALIKNKRKGKPSMLNSIKKYYKDHEDVLFPLLIVIVLDHFFNNGGLRERIVSLAQGLLDGIQEKLGTHQLSALEKKKD
jgi:hypothetical protein